MEPLTHSVLLLGKELEELDPLPSLLHCLPYDVEIARSEEQAIDLSSQNLPCLVILAGNDRPWSASLVDRLRHQARVCGVTILALTEHHAPHWLPDDYHLGIDGYLVQPLRPDILVSLVESAKWKQVCCWQKC
ncbi:hypothetical protein [Roseofilum casamattae]|uniref:Response regulatory domain-containing protein n=1 Tax=Roseofilum casamattae BLCC-M143 TaxID=3022442 RepID=A0ABT7BYP3_9CYAN|nr:hypothetical protein [Roseofilum casamattae]MDJ1183576.1 hypothetical protein [Roseofilum casamattae BLCC-M143]